MVEVTLSKGEREEGKKNKLRFLFRHCVHPALAWRETAATLNIS